MNAALTIGRITIPHDEAEHLMRETTLKSQVFTGFPAYDTLWTTDDPNSLTDPDLLAPALIRGFANWSAVPAFTVLKRYQGYLSSVLAEINPDLDLIDADDGDLDALGALFEPLDHRLEHAGPATFAKVLHRKRPRLVPIYDLYLESAYQEGVRPYVPAIRGRKWREFMVKLARRLRDDLQRDLEAWDRIRAIPSPVVSRVRALDILALSPHKPRAEEEVQ